jgi:class 3 adenylate cyclase
MAEERPQRRLAAILAADVVGYSRLMEEDEAGTLLVLKNRRYGILKPLVAEHRGRVVKVMGDGVLVEFGSAVNAVACAVELQKKMSAANDSLGDNRRIELRIGINLGDVIVEGSDIYGDGVNIAARLQVIAEPGGICVLLSNFSVLPRWMISPHVRQNLQMLGLGPQVALRRSSPSCGSLNNTQRLTFACPVRSFILSRSSVERDSRKS